MSAGKLPSDLLDPTDKRHRLAAIGDGFIRRGLRRHCLGPWVFYGLLLMIILAVALGYLNAIYGTFPAMMVWIIMGGSIPAVPWFWDFRRPVLALRSFTETRTKIGEYDRGSGESWDVGGRNSYLWEMGLRLWSTARVIGMSHEESDFGTYFGIVVYEDNDWLDQLLRIADASWVIVVFPASTPSCVRELKALSSRADLLSKTVVFMPPVSDRANVWSAFTSRPRT